jgi:hypothetical protein
MKHEEWHTFQCVERACHSLRAKEAEQSCINLQHIVTNLKARAIQLEEAFVLLKAQSYIVYAAC